MNSFELNKYIGAFLGVVFIVFSVSLISDAVFSSPEPETPGYAIAVPETTNEGGAEAEEEEETVLPLLASADVSAGESVYRRCVACHTPEEGGPNKVGPNLWDIVDRPIAAHEGFNYSGALTEYSEGGQKPWTYEELDHFLANPKGLVPGTAMSFAGLRNVEDRANLIAYLRTLSNDPAPLPEAAPAAEEDGAAPAEGGEEAAPAEDGAQAPAEESAPAEEAAPAEDNAAPAEESTAPAETVPAETPAEQEEEAAPAAPEGGQAGDAVESQPLPAQ